MVIIDKKQNIKLCIGLRSKELACKCDDRSCRSTIVTKKLIEVYGRFRKAIKKPLKINSGYRCALHNYNVKGVSRSRHTCGQAIDIALSSFGDDYDKKDIKMIAKTSGFTFVKFYKPFVHLDVR